VDVTERVEFQERQKKYSQELEEQVRLRTEELQRKVRELEEMTAKLEMTNAELEAFTFSVSHDLRAPLRTMEGFADALEEDFGEHFPPGAKSYLERIVASARKMDELIDDLLRYSRISKQEISLTKVDMDEVVKDVLEQLGSEVEKAGARVEVDYPLGVVVGHRTVLEHVVSNLLANSLKFVDNDKSPKVKIYSGRVDSRLRFWFIDNGIGIEERHLDKIFFLFERLHGVEAYSGTGVGLSIVKRGVERMNGKVGVESVPGRGSKFWFELLEA
jgi:light-regulated signal transduction histidine kinase (bacteriophytochrome)